jgi:hypothetical protein
MSTVALTPFAGMARMRRPSAEKISILCRWKDEMTVRLVVAGFG